jgi:hypothetical protein
MQSRSVRTLILWTLALLFSSLACRAATRLIIPDTPTPIPSPTLTLTATPLPTDIPPTATPVFEAACPSLLSQIMTVAKGDPSEDEPSTIHRALRDERDLGYMVNYTIKDDKLSTREEFFVPDDFDKELDTRAAHEWIWDYFAAIIPASERSFVTEFSAISDGQSRILGAVSQSFDSATRWGLRIDVVDASDHYSLTYTLMHEFGHLVTLKPSQVRVDEALFDNPDREDLYEKADAACTRYFTNEGCSTADSYINEFFNRYWTDKYEEWQAIDKTQKDAAYYAALYDFYKAYQDQFLTDYAATSPEEDMAEAWAFFVLAPKPEPNSIADEKILFFYEYPELVRLRQEILTRVCVEFPK